MTDDHADRLRQETERVSAKIEAAYEKLATKLRARAEKAKAALEAKGGAKRAVLQRRFELYADAAHDLEHRRSERRGRDAEASD